MYLVVRNSKDIGDMVNDCKFCQVKRPAQRKEPLIASNLPEGPWLHVAADLFALKGKIYISVIDYYSRYIEIALLSNKTSSTVIAKMKSFFARWGVPTHVTSDNGPEFSSSEFAKFPVQYDFVHQTSSPRFPQSNGEAESGVKISKQICQQDDPWLALMTYRATPTSATKFSPAQLMMGRQIRTTLPVLPRKLAPSWPEDQVVKQNNSRRKESYSKYYDKHNGARDLPVLNPGDQVRIKTDQEKMWNTTGTVIRNDSTPRSYAVETDQGILRRNRRHLQLVPQQVPEQQPEAAMTPQAAATATPLKPQQPQMETSTEIRRSQRTGVAGPKRLITE